MFKMGSFEIELAQSMANHLKGNRLEKKAEADQMHRVVQGAKAVDCLNTAATILEHLGLTTEAEVIVDVLQKIANRHDLGEQEIDLGKKKV